MFSPITVITPALRLPRCALFFLFCLSLAANTSSLASESETLSLSEAQQLSLARSQRMPGQDLLVRAAREMALAAGQLPDPILKMGIDNLPLSGSDRFSLGNDFMTMRRLGLMQELPRSEKLKLRSESFEISAQKALAEKALLRAALLRDSAQAWLERYYAQRMLLLLGAQLKQAKLEIVATESAFRGGRSSQADVLLSHGALAMLEDRQDELQLRLKNARTMLIRWVGQRGELPLAELPDLTRAASLQLARDMASHPQLALLEQQERLAHSEVRLAQANHQPDWSLEFSYQQRGAAYPNMLSLGFSLPLQWDQGKRQGRELSAKLALQEQAQTEREEGLRALSAETVSALNDWDSRQGRLTRFQTELIPLAVQRSSASLAAYRAGKLSLSEVLAARRAEMELGLQSLQLELDSAKLWTQLEYLSPAKEAL